MENNTETTIVQSTSFRQTLVKLAVTTIAAAVAKKVTEELFDRYVNRHQTVTIETIEA